MKMTEIQKMYLRARGRWSKNAGKEEQKKKDKQFDEIRNAERAGDFGTDKLTKSYCADTPGQTNEAKDDIKKGDTVRIKKQYTNSPAEAKRDYIVKELRGPRVLIAPKEWKGGGVIPTESLKMNMIQKAGMNEAFEPHMMYDLDTGKAYKADKEEDHIRMKKLGYSHEKPDTNEARGEDAKGHKIATEKGAGLTQKGVDAYNKKTGGNLKTAVTGKVKAGSKDAGRRKSFCARMSGVKGPMKDEKGRPTRKAMSLKRWKC